MKVCIRALPLLLLTVCNNAYGEDDESSYDFTTTSALKRAIGDEPNKASNYEYRFTPLYFGETNSGNERIGGSQTRLRLVDTYQFSAVVTPKKLRLDYRF